MTKIRHCESFQTTLVGKDWKKYLIAKIGQSETFWTTLAGKDGEKYGMARIGGGYIVQCHHDLKSKLQQSAW